MHVLFESRDPECAQLRDLAVRRVRFVMRRLAWLVPHAMVQQSDVNGPQWRGQTLPIGTENRQLRHRGDHIDGARLAFCSRRRALARRPGVGAHLAAHAWPRALRPARDRFGSLNKVKKSLKKMTQAVRGLQVPVSASLRLV